MTSKGTEKKLVLPPGWVMPVRTDGKTSSADFKDSILWVAHSPVCIVISLFTCLPYPLDCGLCEGGFVSDWLLDLHYLV